MSKFEFSVDVYGNFEKISPVLSKARVRIFYTGLNRNLTYISEEFAEKLLKTLPYTPVVGKFENGDFSDHGRRGEQLQAYGVIPEEPNVKWELHTDYDGVEREYACADVLLWTGRFSEANIMEGKSQSMELYPESVQGKWVYKDGKKFFKFTDGCFLGVTALGDNVEPCFEGAAFYSYADTLKEFASALNEYTKFNEGGKEQMTNDFKLSDGQKYDALLRLLNNRLETEGIIEYAICEVFDEYAVCFCYTDGCYYRAYYTKDDEDDSVEITNKEQCFILDVSKEEYDALQRMSSSYQSYAAIEAQIAEYAKAEDNKEDPEEDPEDKEDEESEDKEDFAKTETESTPSEEFAEEDDKEEEEEEEKKEEEPETESTCGDKKDEDYALQLENLTTEYNELNSKFEEINSELVELRNYKLNAENAKKAELLERYSQMLSEEIISEYTDEVVGNFTYEELEKELAVKVVNTKSEAIFAKNEVEIVPTPSYTGDEGCSKAQRLVNQYKRRINGGNL